MTPSELFSFLKEMGVRPKKGLSQNFLIDGNIARKIVQTAEIQPGEAVLEIGPGPGALTSHLLAKGAFVYAIEKDRALAKALLRLQTKDERLFPFHFDALDFPFQKLPSPLKVVANLPYHITTPLLEKFFERAFQFSSLTLMVQKEVGKRLLAKCGTKEFGSLTLFTQFYTAPKTSFKVSASCFYPQPKVDSFVLKLEMQKTPLDPSAPFFALVRRAFQQRRKKITSSLRDIYPAHALQKALLFAGANADARPETLSLKQWLRFYESFLPPKIASLSCARAAE